MNANQEPKYEIKNGKLHNRQSGQQIPDDEPVFILRARDVYAFDAIADYFRHVVATCPSDHREAVIKRMVQFHDWASNHPSRMKQPDTVLTNDWQGLK